MSPSPAPSPPPSSVRREVFYAAYGSNLSAERFACYLAGGAAPGSSHVLRGARDPQSPVSWRALRVPGSLWFSGHTRSWGGAAAFFEPGPPGERSGAEALVRAWRIGWDQFEDVLAQENGRATHSLHVEPGVLVEGFTMVAGSGRYDHLLCLGTLEDLPVLTFTAHGSLGPAPPAAPSLGYLAHIIIGLREAFGLDDRAVVDYLGRAPGADPDLVRAALKP